MTYTPKPLSEFEPFSTYRNARGFSTYMDLPSDAYDTLERRKVRWDFLGPFSDTLERRKVRRDFLGPFSDTLERRKVRWDFLGPFSDTLERRKVRWDFLGPFLGIFNGFLGPFFRYFLTIFK